MVTTSVVVGNLALGLVESVKITKTKKQNNKTKQNKTKQNKTKQNKTKQTNKKSETIILIMKSSTHFLP